MAETVHKDGKDNLLSHGINEDTEDTLKALATTLMAPVLTAASPLSTLLSPCSTYMKIPGQERNATQNLQAWCWSSATGNG